MLSSDIVINARTQYSRLPTVMHAHAIKGQSSIDFGVDNSDVYTTGGKCTQAVQNAAWQLVQISNDLNDIKCAALTGNLLAAIGPFPSGAVMHPQLDSPSSVPGIPAALLSSPASGGRKSSGTYSCLCFVNELLATMHLLQHPYCSCEC